MRVGARAGGGVHEDEDLEADIHQGLSNMTPRPPHTHTLRP